VIYQYLLASFLPGLLANMGLKLFLKKDRADAASEKNDGDEELGHNTNMQTERYVRKTSHVESHAYLSSNIGQMTAKITEP
jgi:hypothetical protein